MPFKFFLRKTSFLLAPVACGLPAVPQTATEQAAPGRQPVRIEG